MKLHLHVRLKYLFPVTLAASASLYQFQVCIVVRKKTIEQTIFRLFVKFSIGTSQLAFIDIIMIIRGEIKV